MSFVYFLRPVGLRGPVKIGCSRQPQDRRHEYQKWSPIPVELVAQIRGELIHERRFHAMFEASHSHCEWFHASDELDAVIARIRAGSFSLDELPKKGVALYHVTRLREAAKRALQEAA